MQLLSTKLSFPSSLAAVAVVGLLSATPAHAVTNILTIGNSATYTVQTGDKFLIDLGASRSYACEAVPLDPLTEFDFDQAVVGQATSGESIQAKFAGSIVPQIGGETGGNADNRVTVTPTTTDRFALTVATAKSGGELVEVRCYATTLFGGYNTNVNDFNFLELTNTGNQTLSGTITAINFDGTTVIDGLAFSVPAQRRVDVDLHSPAGPNKFGLVRVTTDGPLGTLQANVSQYSGTVSNFSLQGSAPLVAFEQKP